MVAYSRENKALTPTNDLLWEKRQKKAAEDARKGMKRAEWVESLESRRSAIEEYD